MADKPTDMKLYWETAKTDSGEEYYYCDATQETTYDYPLDKNAKALVLPFGWQAIASDQGEPYFFNPDTNVTDWDIPAGTKRGSSVKGSASATSGSGGGNDAATNEASRRRAVVHDTRVYWEIYKDDSGEDYYSQPDSGETSYDKPSALITLSDGTTAWPVILPFGWISAITEAPPKGEVYFAKGDDTTWDLPAGSIYCAKESAAAPAAAPAFKPAAAAAGVASAAPVPVPAPAPAPAPAAAPVPAGRKVDKEQALKAAQAALRTSVLAWYGRKTARAEAESSGNHDVLFSLPPNFKRRYPLYRHKKDDYYVTVNPYEREVMRQVAVNPMYERVGSLTEPEIKVYANFSGSIDATAAPVDPRECDGDTLDAARAQPKEWIAALNPDGRAYYFPFNTIASAAELAVVWMLPSRVMGDMPVPRVVARFVPKQTVNNASYGPLNPVARANSVMSAVSLIRARKRTAAEQGTAKMPQRMEGLLQKSNARGQSLKTRWVIVDARKQEICWYASDPSAASAKSAKGKGAAAAVQSEPVIGRMGIAGGTILPGVYGHLRNAEHRDIADSCALTLQAPGGRVLVLVAASADQLETWKSYIKACAEGTIPVKDRDPVPAGTWMDEDDVGVSAVPPAPGYLVPIEGWVNVSTKEGQMKKQWVALDPDSRLLMVFEDNGKGPGSERAVCDMLASIVDISPLPGSPMVDGREPVIYLSVDDQPVFGPPLVAKGQPDYHATALVFSNQGERDVWLACLQEAVNPESLRQLQDETMAAKLMSSALMQPTLLHVQRNAGFLSSLGGMAERGVTLNTAEKTLTIFSDHKSSKKAVELRLSFEGVRIDFSCDAAGSKPEAKAVGWSRLRFEVTAPTVDDKKSAPTLQTHVFRTKTYQNYTAWASALASL